MLQKPNVLILDEPTIEANSRCDGAYVTMNVLATLIACYGLLENSPAVVIGAMLIALLLDPISGVALSLVDDNDTLLRRAFLSVLAGVAVVYATALVCGALHATFPLTAEIYARTAPDLMDLMIALFGGAAGAYAITSARLNGALVGVAISTALVPSLASSAICLARGEYRLSAGALLLTFANIVGIQAASSLLAICTQTTSPTHCRCVDPLMAVRRHCYGGARRVHHARQKRQARRESSAVRRCNRRPAV